MRSSVQFNLSPDSALTEVMATFVDLNRRPVKGIVTVEELLIHLLSHAEAKTLCIALRVDTNAILSDAEQALLECVQQGISLRDPSDSYLPPVPGEFPERTEEFEHVLLTAIATAQNRATTVVGLSDLLLAISRLDVGRSHASRVIHDHGLTPRLLGLYAARQHGASTHRDQPSYQSVSSDSSQEPRRDRFVYDLSVESKGWHDRHHLVDEGLRLLATARQPNLILVGPPAVGKESLAVELARRLIHGPCPPALGQVRVLGLDLDALVAGCQFRSQLEERIRKYVVEPIEAKKVSKSAVVLWVGDMGQVLAYARKDLDVLTTLRLAMRRGHIRLMGSATTEQFKRLEEHDPTLAQQCVQMKVSSPTDDDIMTLAQTHTQAYADHHQVSYPIPLLEQALVLVDRHLPARPRVQALLHTLDEAGAHAMSKGRNLLVTDDVLVAIARQAQLNVDILRGGDAARVNHVEAHLRKHLVGQEEALVALVNTLRRSAVGLGDGGKTKPLGAFLFAGPTGVGKTEMVKRLAEGMDAPLVRLDMSEFSEGHTVSRLIGAPPGYLGHMGTPILAKALARSPRAVILLDEFEKAASEVHMLFLQILDCGTLTDGQGQLMDFRQCLFVFTSNVGATEAAKNPVGFLHDTHEAEHRREQALTRCFPPELRNRFDHIIQFHALLPSDMAGVVERSLAKLVTQLKERGHRVRFSAALRHHLAIAGYDPQMGARPLQRLIDQHVTQALADALLVASGPVNVSVSFRLGKVQVKLLST